MESFFQALSDFLESDLAKSHGWTILVSFIVLMFIIGYAIWFVMDKIVIAAKTIEADKAIEESKKLKEENENLKKEIEELKNKLKHFKFLEALDSPTDDLETELDDKALKSFATKK